MTTRETSQLNKQEDLAKSSAVTKIVCVGVTIGSFFLLAYFFAKPCVIGISC
jgi:hypothetical protein